MAVRLIAVVLAALFAFSASAGIIELQIRHPPGAVDVRIEYGSCVEVSSEAGGIRVGTLAIGVKRGEQVGSARTEYFALYGMQEDAICVRVHWRDESGEEFRSSEVSMMMSHD